ncbi:MAG: peptide antibiotic transporter SbmA, partial [Granulosicoccus sp.]
IAVWYGGGSGWGEALFGATPADAPPVIGLGHFVTPEFLWFYLFFFFFSGAFIAFWHFRAQHPWELWSVAGAALILFVTYFNVQVSVAINNWRRPFFDGVQDALSDNATTTAADLFGFIWIFAQLAFMFIAVIVVFRYFVSHWIFRWRTAMNNYYMERWKRVRHIEGASQRVQEDTMRFAGIMENLGSAFISSIMTLIAFLPLLWTLSEQITELPIIGAVNGSLVFLALLSAIFGTVLLAAVGYRLPGLEFNNQKVEAAYRKELVYGEDYEDRAEPIAVQELFGNVRKNYFKLYFNYLYFNVFRYAYLQGANFIPLIALGPTFVAGAITFGFYQQISNAFGRVENSFQFLVDSWTTIVELMSIYKRLMAFESRIDSGVDSSTGEPAMTM